MENIAETNLRIQIYKGVFLQTEIKSIPLSCRVIFKSPYFENGKSFYDITRLEYEKLTKENITEFLINIGTYVFKVHASNENFIKNRLKEQTVTFAHGDYRKLAKVS